MGIKNLRVKVCLLNNEEEIFSSSQPATVYKRNHAIKDLEFCEMLIRKNSK